MGRKTEASTSLAGIIQETVWDSARRALDGADIAAATVDGQPAWIIPVWNAADPDGANLTSRKSRKREDVGQFVEQLNSHTIHPWASPALLEQGRIGLIPDVECDLREYPDVFTTTDRKNPQPIPLDLAIVHQDGTVEDTGCTIKADNLVDMIERHAPLASLQYPASLHIGMPGAGTATGKDTGTDASRFQPPATAATAAPAEPAADPVATDMPPTGTPGSGTEPAGNPATAATTTPATASAADPFDAAATPLAVSAEDAKPDAGVAMPDTPPAMADAAVAADAPAVTAGDLDAMPPSFPPDNKADMPMPTDPQAPATPDEADVAAAVVPGDSAIQAGPADASYGHVPVRTFTVDDQLDLHADTGLFDQRFTEQLPWLDTSRTPGQGANDELNEHARNANTAIRAELERVRSTLRQAYETALDEHVRQLMWTFSVYGGMADVFDQDVTSRVASMRQDMETAMRGRIDRLEQDHQARRAAYIDQACQAAAMEFDRRHQRNLDAGRQAIEEQAHADMDSRESRIRAQFHDTRRAEAKSQLEDAQNICLDSLAGEWNQAVEAAAGMIREENGKLDALGRQWAEQATDYADTKRENERLKDANQRLKDELADQLAALEADRDRQIGQLRAQYEQDVTTQTADLRRQLKEASERADRDSKRIDVYQEDLRDAQNRLANLDEQKSRDWQTRIDSIIAEKNLWAERASEAMRTQKHSSVLNAGMAVIACLLALGIGVLAGAHFLGDGEETVQPSISQSVQAQEPADDGAQASR